MCDMDQIVDPTKLWMHAIETLNLVGQVLLFEDISDLPNGVPCRNCARRRGLIENLYRTVRSWRTTGRLVCCQGFWFRRVMCQEQLASTRKERVLSCAYCLCPQPHADCRCMLLSSTRHMCVAGSGSDAHAPDLMGCQAHSGPVCYSFVQADPPRASSIDRVASCGTRPDVGVHRRFPTQSRRLPCSTIATEIPVDGVGRRIRLPNVLTLLWKVSGVLLGRAPWHLIEFEVNVGRGSLLRGRH